MNIQNFYKDKQLDRQETFIYLLKEIDKLEKQLGGGDGN